MSHLFTPARPLLLPQFETYRLHSLDPSSDVASTPLPSGQHATQSRATYAQHKLSFREVRARIGWDHLAVGKGGRGVFISEEMDVVGFQLDEDLNPTFTTLASLPTPISSSSSSAPSEYPSVLALDSTHWALSPGSSPSLYILETSALGETLSGSIIAQYDLTLPFLLRSAHVVSPYECRLLLSRSVPKESGRTGSARKDEFEILEVKVNMAKRTRVDEAEGKGEDLQVQWVKRGGDSPVFAGWWLDGWVVLCEEEMRDPRQSSGMGEGENEESEAERRKQERAARIARLGLGASLPPSVSQEGAMDVDEQASEPDKGAVVNEVTEEKVWPFSWTQTSDSVSIVIPLPAGTTRADLSVQLGPTTLSASLGATALAAAQPVLATFLAKPVRTLWTTIDVSSSTWSFNPQKCQLEIDLVKADEHTRWPSVFLPVSPMGDDGDEEEEEEEVPETLSAEQMAAVRNTFSQIKTRQEGEPEGNHPAIPSLLREEMEYDLEDGEDFGEQPDGAFAGGGGGAKVGRDVLIGFVRSEDGKERWSKGHTCVLSLPMSGRLADGLVIKSGVDGLLFAPPLEAGADLTKVPWRHMGTNPALAFVLSSKRDLRLVRHGSTSLSVAREPAAKKLKTGGEGAGGDAATVLAFDSGSSSTLSGNVYVYYPAVSKTHGKQGVVRVSGVERGALLGVGQVEVGGKHAVVGLCEKELVVLTGVI